MSRHVHRISLPASIMFDIESESAELPSREDIVGELESMLDSEFGITIAFGPMHTRVYPDGLGANYDWADLTFEVADTTEIEEAE